MGRWAMLIAQRRVHGARRWMVAKLTLDAMVDFLSMNRYVRRRTDAEFHSVTPNFQYRYYDGRADENLLVGSSTRDQHAS